MSETPSGRIIGGVVNGPRLAIVFPFFNGMAGVRDRGEFYDVAYIGAKPTETLPIDGTVGGKAAKVTGFQPSDTTRGMIVLMIEGEGLIPAVEKVATESE